MSERRLVAAELAKLFGALSNPLRVQIIEELGDRELTVNELQGALAVPHALVSQHLGVLRANRLVIERRQGKHVYYHLRQPDLASIIRQCLMFISPDKIESERILDAIDSATNKWSNPASEPKTMPVPKSARRRKGSSA
jgi:DNA-binding transcriptional ArsR family regulator